MYEWTIIQAAIRHVSRPEFKGDKTEGCIFYLKCVADIMQKRSLYTLSYQARRLWRRIESDQAVNPVYRELKELMGKNEALQADPETPASNTGVTPTYQAALEEYLNG